MNAHAPILTNDPWDFWWRLGYRWLTPIMPPGCQLSPTSSIFKKIAKGGKDDRGKAPGVRLNNGLWVGHDFTTCRPNLRQIEAWRDMGASIGIVLGEGLVAIDADCLENEYAEACAGEIETRLGVLPCRIGMAPKRLYVCRTAPSYEYRCVLFGPRNEKGLQDNRVEILSTNRQFVAWGMHPGTMRPYEWARGPLPLESVPYVEPEALDALMDTLQARLPHAEPVEIGLARRDVGQASLKAEKLEVALAAAAALPNTSALFPRRNDYIRVGAAFKATFADWPNEGLEAWCAWGDKYPPGTNDRETMESDWQRIKAPFDIGAQWLYAKASKHSNGQFTIAQAFHEDVVDPQEPEKPKVTFSKPASYFEGVPIQPQKWLVNEFIPARNVTLLYGDGGTGKSLISLQLAFACATATKWLGMDVAEGCALFVTAEDEDEELHRRLAAITSSAGFMFEELDRLFVRSLSGQDAVLAAPKLATGLMEPTKRFAELRADVRRLRPVVVVLDTLADLFGGDEIKRIQARQFIQLLQGLVVEADWDLTVVLLAHPSLSGMNSGSGTSGNTAWSNSVRSRLYLERKLVARGETKIEPDTDLRVLSTKKANRTKLGGEILVRWSAGRFIAETAQNAAREAADDIADETAFLTLLAQFNKAGRFVSPNAAAPSYAPRQFLTAKLGSELGKARLEGAMSRLFEQDVIALEPYGPPSKRYNRMVEASKP